MEFVVVTFSGIRAVHVDGAPRGQTGQLLRLQAGTHNFDLGTPVNYTPASVMTPVRGTTAASPMVIAFMPLLAAATRGRSPRVGLAPPAPVRTRSRKSPRTAQRTTKATAANRKPARRRPAAKRPKVR